MGSTFELVKEFRFEAAHSLPFVSEGHRCARLHGHSYRIEIIVKGEIDDAMGWVIDYSDISKVVKPIVKNELDHRLLNDIEGLENPTSEILARWLWRRIKPDIQELHCISVAETESSKCLYYGD
jgi:6-pyruvoyltetrahydropterin/6-carboxytetrahydropterin synthase